MDQSYDYLRLVASSKASQIGNPNWYKETMMSNLLPSEDICWNSGINKKTLSNTFGSADRTTVIRESNNHYDGITNLINNTETDVNLTFSVTVNDNQVNFTSEESLKILNALSVRRAAISGGLWSTAGKRVEKPLVSTLCRLLNVPARNFNQQSTLIPNTLREVDYYIIDDTTAHRSEVKLMGRGNPESADVVHARNTSIFIADRLSTTNKTQFDAIGVHWVAMDDGDTLGQFSRLLTGIGIENTPFTGDLNSRLDEIFLDTDF